MLNLISTPFTAYFQFLPCKTRVLTKITQKLPKREVQNELQFSEREVKSKREVHHRQSNFLVREVLSKREGRNFPNGQELPKRARTSRTGKNFPFGVVARTVYTAFELAILAILYYQ